MTIKIDNPNSLGGPGIFLTRLKREIGKRDLSNFANGIISNGFVSTNEKYILRLDGINFVKMTPSELSTFLTYRWKPEFRYLSKVNNILYHLFGERYENFSTPFLTNFFFKRLNNRLFKSIRKADCVVYQSEFSKNIHKHFCPEYGKGKNIIINNGVNLEKFSPSASNRNNQENIQISGDLKLVFSGLVRLWKRAHEIVKILPMIKKYIPDTKLYFLGELDIPSKSVINRLIAKNNLQENVVFLGRINHEDLPYYYSNMDIMVHPAWFDSCPNAVVEALSCGVPVVCPSTGGTPELVGNGGAIVEEKFDFKFTEYYNINKIPKINYSRYVSEILKISENKNHFSKLARQRAIDKLDIRIVADKYMEMFEKVLK